MLRNLVWRLGLVVCLVGLFVGLAGVAYADPISQATDAAAAGGDLLVQFGPIWGGMLLLYGAAAKFLSENDSKHWIAKGRWLAAIVAAVGVFAAVLDAHFGSGNWSGVLYTAILSVFKLIKPTVSAPALSSSKQGGFVSSSLVVTLAAIAIGCAAIAGIASCARLKSEGATVKTAAVDCTKGELPKAVAMFTPTVEKLLELATGGDGRVDWSQVEDGTKALAGDVGGCVLSTAVAKALQPAPAKEGAPQSSPLVIDPGDLRAHFEVTRRAKFGGQTFLTAAGPL